MLRKEKRQETQKKWKETNNSSSSEDTYIVYDKVSLYLHASQMGEAFGV